MVPRPPPASYPTLREQRGDVGDCAAGASYDGLGFGRIDGVRCRACAVSPAPVAGRHRNQNEVLHVAFDDAGVHQRVKEGL